MNRIEKLNKFYEALDAYYDCIDNVAEKGSDITKYINGMIFADKKKVQEWKEYLDAISTCTKKLRSSYAEAGLGELPSSAFEASFNAKNVYEKLMSRQAIADAFTYLRKLVCSDESLNVKLKSMQKEIPVVDVFKVDDEDTLNSLERYVALKNALETPVRETRFAELLKVGSNFDSSLLFAVFEHRELFAIEEKCLEVKVESQDESMADEPITSLNLSVAEVPDTTAVGDKSEEIKIVSEDLKVVENTYVPSTSVEVGTAMLSVEEAAAECNNSDINAEHESVHEDKASSDEEEPDPTQALRLAFAEQSPAIVIRSFQTKKDAGGYTINKFKIEAKGEDSSLLSLVYRLLDKYGYVSVGSPDIPQEKQEDVQYLLERHRSRGYLGKVVLQNHCTYYCLALKGSQAIKDGAFRSYVQLGKNAKRADIHNFRDYNDFNVGSYVKLRDLIRSVGVKADAYAEKEMVRKNSYSMNYEALDAAKPAVRVIGFTELNFNETSAMTARLNRIEPDKEIIVFAGLNGNVVKQVVAWAKSNLGAAACGNQFYTYNATDNSFALLATGETFADFSDIYAKYDHEPVEQEDDIEIVPEETPAISEFELVDSNTKPDNMQVVEEQNPVIEADTCENSVSDTSDNKEEKSEEAIEIPENILVTLDDVEPEIECSEDKEKKSSSSKEFKKVLTQRNVRGVTFNMLSNSLYIHPEILSGFAELPADTCVFELDQLVKMGLLRKATYKDYEPYYMVSPKAEQLCQSETVKSLLRIDNSKKTKANEIKEKIKPLVVEAYLDGIKNICKATHYYKGVNSIMLNPAGFGYGCKPDNHCGEYIWVTGFFAQDSATFAELKDIADNVKKEMLLNIIVALSHEQGKALLNWWHETYPETDMTTLGYKLIGEEAVYTSDENVQYTSCAEMFKTYMEKLEKEINEFKVDVKIKKVERIDKTVEASVTDKSEAAVALPEIKKEKKSIPVPEPVVEEAEPENIVLQNRDKDGCLLNYEKMLMQGKIYAACAYLKVASEKYKELMPIYKQLAYAAGDPLGSCTYTSQVINEVFYGEEHYDNGLLVSAALRNFFYGYYCYDYFINPLMESLKNNELVGECNSLYQLLQDMADFKKEYNSSIDSYADYRSSSNVDIDKELNALKYYASEQFNHYCVKFKEDIANRRFSEARKVVLDKEGPLGIFLQKIIAGDDSIETISAMRTFLQEKYVTDGAVVRKENIANDKIEKVIDEAWNKAADKLNSVIKTSDLMSALRTKFYNQIERLVTPLCDYVALNDAKIPVDNPEASQTYKKMRTKLLKNIGEAKEFIATFKDTNPTAVVLMETLKLLEACINGSYKAGSEKYFYLDFLKTDNVLLNDNYLPYLNEVDEDLPGMSVLYRIEQHISTKELSLEKRAQQILDSEDNYSSLNCILAFLELDNPGYTAKFSKDKSLKLSLDNAAAELDIYRESFENDIELRQSYGQIDETEGNRKEKLLKTIDTWYEWARESMNYGFFHKICNALIAKIEMDALPRGNQLQSRLDKFVRDNFSRLEEELVEDAVATVKERIRIKNYAAAEDLLNRLYSDDDELIPVKNVIDTDYLQNFIRDFHVCYQDVCNMRTNFKSLLLGRAPNNKDGKAANRMVENWMYRPEDCTVERVKALMSSLDFYVGTVTERNKIGGAKLFDVTLARPEDGRKVKHKHPIAPFGSLAETDPFRVAFIFGNYGADDLLGIFNNLGDAQHTLVFMDGAMTMSARRTLARKTKEVTGKIFAVIDRVILAYIHRNYRLATVQKMLMNIIIPFAFYQPYVVDSFVMPPEIFIGREEELKQIEASDGVNIVYGGRQLGKSAMLRMAVNDVDKNERGDRAVFVDIANLDYKEACYKVSMVLHEDEILEEDDYTDDWSELCHRLRMRLKSDKNRIPYFLLLLDEADKFIKTAAEVNYSPLENLKDVQGIGVGRFKFVFAGLRDVIRFDRNQALSNNSIMTKLSKLTVKPFNVNEARVLLEQPLGYLGLRFAKDEATESLIASIFSTTNYFPGLLQLYCANLVKALQKADYAGYDEIDTPPYEVSVEHIKKVLGGKELQSQIREKFFITLQLGENEDKYYYIIAHLIALQHHRDAENSDVTPQMLLDLANEYAIKRITDLDEQKVYALMEELCELNILHTAGNGYRFTRYSFYQMMGSVEHIENELLKFLED